MSRTQDALRSPMFEEHIVATLKKRPFNRDNVTAKETAAVFKNLNGMQQEALQMSADTARQIAEERRR
jgi:N-dimethylarginine dimethylaminohydrolase